MKHTERINRINDNLNKHFKSNNDAWWVNNDTAANNAVKLHQGRGGDDIQPEQVAMFILKTEKSVDRIDWAWNVFTRNSLRSAGYKI